MTMHIGVMLNNLERDRLLAWQVVVEAGFTVVHTNAIFESWLDGPQRSQYIEAAQASGLDIHTMFIGFDGQDYSDVDAIVRTVGLLPVRNLRRRRIGIAKKYSDLARELGVPRLAMHLGFMPHDTDDPDYRFLVEAVRDIADYCAAKNQSLHFETGQETALELSQFINEVGRPNLGVNFDCGNFLLYGTGEPLHALRVLGTQVGGVHCKDGHRPTESNKLGREVPLGRGEMDFPRFLGELQKLGYSGPLIIERECGPDAASDIQEANQFLLNLADQLN